MFKTYDSSHLVVILISLLSLSFHNNNFWGVSSEIIRDTTATATATATTADISDRLHSGFENRRWSKHIRRLFQRDHGRQQRRVVDSQKEEGNNIKQQQPKEKKMGQAIRMVQYDRTANERNAIGALNFLDHTLSWYPLDDGVMGGQSSTTHSCLQNGSLHFTGEINTNGGGFCSIRTSILPSSSANKGDDDDNSSSCWPPNTRAIRLGLIGDGKTYKLLLSDGTRNTFGPSLKSPSWQADIATTKLEKEQVVIIPFTSLVPSWGGGPRSQPSDEVRSQVQFKLDEMKEIGIMLSLQLSDGSPNPKETFGEGIFPFSLQINSIEPVVDDNTML